MSEDGETRLSKRLKSSNAEGQSRQFYLRNSELRSNSPGLIYRRSMNWWDRHSKDSFVSWESLICGVVKRDPKTDDNWLHAEGGYLPIIKWGCRLLFPTAEEEDVVASDTNKGADGGFLERTQQNKVDGALGPMMPPKDAEIFSKLLEGATSFFEFGCGGSTVHALSYPNLVRICSVESNSQWLDALRGRKDISEAIACGRLRLVHADIGPVVRTGWPADESAKDRWPTYSGSVMESEHTFDLVLVDGRFRTACFLKSLQRILSEKQNRAVLAMHNFYSSGEHEVRYPAITKFVDTVAELDYGETIGVFLPKTEIDPTALAAAIEEFEHNPR
mmetsp:Transcript_25842/g.34927  ORF Transcript_25842/g.34927 Transcript_25842/m.34927 type:complete len:332 (-) Transcript_25842:54-1049(-)